MIETKDGGADEILDFRQGRISSKPLHSLKNEKGKIPNFLRINDLCLFLCLHTFTRIKLHENTQQINLKKRK